MNELISDPKVLSALITAAAPIAKLLFDRAFAPFAKTDEEKVLAHVRTNYDKLKSFITSNSLRMLVYGEDGARHDVHEFREYIHADYKPTTIPAARRIDGEFAYRLRYLALAGFFEQTGSEYYVTKLGSAFIAVAREKRDYPDVLFVKK